MAKGKREVKGWITVNGVHVPIYENYSVRDKAEPKAKGAKFNSKEAWRKKDPKFQQKTEGGVYFYSSDNPIWGADIDERLYSKLPSYIKKSVVSLDNTKTLDGSHCDIYYVDKDGTIRYFDEYGVTDFMYGLKSSGKDEFGVVSDWQYDGDYKEGKQLTRRNKDGKNAATEGRSDASKGKQVEGKGAVKDVEGKKSDNWNVDHVRNDILPSNTSDKEKSDYINFLHNKGKINDSEKAELMNELGSKSATTQKEPADVSATKAIMSKEAAQGLGKLKDKYANRDWNKDVEDSKRYGYSEQTEEGKKPVTKAEESSKVDRKQDAIDYIAKREDVHPSVAKDTYEHMSESERNHVANEAFKSRTSSKATPRPTTPENAQNQSREDFVENLVVGKGYSRNDAEKMADTMGYEKKESSKPAATPTISPKTQKVADNAKNAQTGSAQPKPRPTNFKEGLKQHPDIQRIAEEQNNKVWNGGATNKELYDAADRFSESKNFNKDKVRDAAFSAFNEKWWATNKAKQAQKENASSQSKGENTKEAKGSIPTTVSGLRSAYAEATGSEKAAIASELRKKGYSLIGGKWIKA